MEAEILKIFNKITAILSLISTTFTSLFGVEWVLFLGYLILNISDYITGTLKAKINKTENSNKGLLGIIKKVCYWILIFISFLISYLLVQIGTKLNINLNFIMLFGWFTLACLIINESRSIIENLIEIGIEVPEILAKGLNTYYNILEKKSNTLTEKNSQNNKKES
mgnify:CR=1 FL=1